MKHIYISFDVVGDEIIDSFVRKNDEAAKRDFITAFKKQSRDDSQVMLFRAVLDGDDDKYERLVDDIPVVQIWDSKELEESNND